MATTVMHQPCSYNGTDTHTKSDRASTKSDLLISTIDPVHYLGGASGVGKSDHACDGRVTVLAVPPFGPTVVGADTSVVVRCTSIYVSECIRGKDGRCSV